MQIHKTITTDFLSLTLYVNVLNVFNTKNVLNVYPTTGAANDDGWFANVLAAPYLQTPGYEQFYRDINLKNRWAYMSATGNDIYGTPRQVQFGLRVEM